MSIELSLISLLISAAFIGLTGIYPGGIIVPAYLVLFLNQPHRILTTLAIALLTLITFKLISRYTILFGRRRFVFIIITAAVWTYLWTGILPGFLSIPLEYRVIGWIIPGLIANHFEKQGILITTSSLFFVTFFTFITGRLLQTLI